MKKLELLKQGASLVVSVGVGAIVGNAIKGTTPASVGKVMKICIAAGSMVLTGIAADMAGKYTEAKIDEGVEMVKGIIEDEPDSDQAVTEET